jgi:signal transduction histidine kinase
MYKRFESLEKSASKWNSSSKRHWNKHQCICWWKMFLSIIQNIVSNAIKHSFIGGTIVVSATVESER